MKTDDEPIKIFGIPSIVVMVVGTIVLFLIAFFLVNPTLYKFNDCGCGCALASPITAECDVLCNKTCLEVNNIT